MTIIDIELLIELLYVAVVALCFWFDFDFVAALENRRVRKSKRNEFSTSCWNW